MKNIQYHLVLVYFNGYWEIDLGTYDVIEARSNYHFLRHSGSYKRKDIKLVSLPDDKQETIDQYMRTIQNPHLIY